MSEELDSVPDFRVQEHSDVDGDERQVAAQRYRFQPPDDALPERAQLLVTVLCLLHRDDLP